MSNPITPKPQWALGASVTLAASLLIANAASAQQLTTVTAGGGGGFMMFSGSSTLTLGTHALDLLDTGMLSVQGYGAATATVQKDADGYFSQVAAITPNTFSTVDLQQATVYAIGSMGGISITAPFLKSVTAGGSLTITDLTVDFGTKVITGTLIGGNGLGTVQNVALWSADNLNSSIQGCPGNGGMCDSPLGNNPEYRLHTTLSGLHLTAEGHQAFVQALGLQTLGQAALNSATDFGTFSSSTLYFSGPSLSVVPESGTWALMGLGLIGLFGVARRKAR